MDRKIPSPLTPFSSSSAHRKPKTIVPAMNTTVRMARLRREWSGSVCQRGVDRPADEAVDEDGENRDGGGHEQKPGAPTPKSVHLGGLQLAQVTEDAGWLRHEA